MPDFSASRRVDRALIINLAQRLRRESGFRERVKAFLDNGTDGDLADRVKKLEQQGSRLLSGAIVMPRAALRVSPSTPDGTR